MDQNEMQLVAHFRLLLRKETGDKIDLLQFSNDVNYAKDILIKAIKSKNEELITTAVKIAEGRGITLVEKAADQSDDDKLPPGGKYVGRLR